MRSLNALEPAEIRVLGSLLEKEQATPEYYPMTLKALVAACNQKTNRHPVMSLGEVETLNILRVLLQEDLVERVSGPRADRWNHNVDPILRYRPKHKAVVTVLLLRGPQTPGELRGRSERLHPLSRGEVEEVLLSLAEGDDPLVVELTRQPGQKETRWALKGSLDVEDEAAFSGLVPADVPDDPDVMQRLDRLEKTVEEIQDEMRALGALRRKLLGE